MAAKPVIRVGIAGIGFMGVTHFRALANLPGVRVEAIAEMDERKRQGDWSQVRGNFGAAGGKVDLSGIRTYQDYRDMARDPNLDLIDLCLPTPAHPAATRYCLASGKHVLCEKPIALNLKDADGMLAEAKKSGKHLFVGQVLRYFPEYRFLKQVYESRKYGELVAARFRRIIARPSWPSGGTNWFADPKKSGGAGIDLHIHDADFVLYLLGRPKGVSSLGVPCGTGAFDYLANQYDYGKKGPIVSSEGGWIAAAALPFEQSYEAYFEKGTLVFNSSNCPLTLYGADGKTSQPRLPVEDGFIAEWKAILKPLREGVQPTELLGSSARESLALVLAEQESARTGKKVKM